MRSTIGVAASVLIGGLIWWFGIFGPQPLYARALEALRQARTVHLVGKTKQGEAWVKRAEVWYDRQRGVREWKRQSDRTTIRIDDGSYQWEHELGRKTAVRSRSTDPLGLVAEALDPERTLKHCRRDPSGDRAIDGVPCKLHVFAPEDKSYRYFTWMDDAYRIRRFRDETFRDGAWQEEELIEVQYDVAIEASRFQPEFGKQVKIIDTVDAADRLLSLEDVLYRQDAHGITVAVHQLQRVTDTMVFVVFSTRPTDETINRLGPIRSRADRRGSLSYGDFNLYLPTRRVGEGQWCHYQPQTLARYYNDGVRIEWALVLHRGPWPARIDPFQFSGRLDFSLQLQAERKQAGLPDRVEYFPMTTLPVPAENVPLRQVIAQVYRAASVLEPTAFQMSLQLEPRPLSEEEIQQQIKSGVSEREARGLRKAPIVSPSRISLQEFEHDVRARLAHLER